MFGSRKNRNHFAVRTFLDAVGSQKDMLLPDLINATMAFCETTRPKDGHELTATEVNGTTTIFIFMYLAVPFWQWRRLNRIVRYADEQLTKM